MMIPKIALIALCISAAYAKCGTPKITPDTSRIVGGKEAKPHSWPWMAALFMKQGIFGSFQQFCGGSLIAPDWILTAGHCFYGQTNTGKFKILLGAHYKNKAEDEQQWAYVKEIHMHPQYNPKTTQNDICLLKLTAPVKYTDYVSPVCIAEETDSVATNTYGYVSGWGTIKAQGVASDKLLQVDIPTIDQSKCKSLYSDAVIDGTMMCGGYDQGGKDSCQGDSGGPYVFQEGDGSFKQHGIVSWGYGCANPKQPGVYSRISALRSFITKTVGNL